MPRIPTVPGGRSESTATGILSPTATNAAFQNVAQDLNRLAVIQGRIAEEDQRQRDSVYMSKSLLYAEEALSELYAAAMESEDYESASATFQEGAAAAGLATGGGFSNEEDAAKYALSFTRNVASKQIQIENRARRLRSAEHRDTLTGLADQSARAWSQLPVDDDMGRSAIRKTLEEALAEGQASGAITDADNRLSGFDETADRYTTRRMSGQNPELLKQMLAETDDAGNKVNFLHLKPADRLAAGEGADRDIKQRKILEKAEAADAKYAATIEFMKRQEGVSDDPSGPPNPEEILNSGIGVSSIDMLIKRGDNIADGKDLTRDNEATKTRLGLDVMTGRITEPGDLIPFVNRGGPDPVSDGISFATFSAFVDEIGALRNSPERRAQQKRLADVIAGFEKEIVTNPMLDGADSAGQANFNSFVFEIERQFFKGIEDGLTTEQLLNQNSPHYIIDLGPYRRTREQLMRDARAAMGMGQKEPERDENGEVVTPPGQKKPGQTADDFLGQYK